MPREAHPWRKGPFPDGGPLTEDQIAKLAERFGIDERHLRTMSERLTSALTYNAASELGIIEVLMRRKKGSKLLETASTDLTTAIHRMDRAVAALNRIRVFDHKERQPPDDPFSVAKQLLRDGQSRIGSATRLLESMRKRDNYFSLIGWANKRCIRDTRRYAVCTAAFDAWEAGGLKLGTTYDPSAGIRTGPLIDFVNAIAMLVSDPPTWIDGETIRKDLNQYREWRQGINRTAGTD